MADIEISIRLVPEHPVLGDQVTVSAKIKGYEKPVPGKGFWADSDIDCFGEAGYVKDVEDVKILGADGAWVVPSKDDLDLIVDAMFDDDENVDCLNEAANKLYEEADLDGQ